MISINFLCKDLESSNWFPTIYTINGWLALGFQVEVSRRFADCDLVGGFNPSEKYARQNDNLPQIGVKIKNIWNHHLVISTWCKIPIPKKSGKTRIFFRTRLPIQIILEEPGKMPKMKRSAARIAPTIETKAAWNPLYRTRRRRTFISGGCFQLWDQNCL